MSREYDATHASVPVTRSGNEFTSSVSELNTIEHLLPTGRMDRGVTDLLRGVDFNGSSTYGKPDVENSGLTFVVRPQLNLADYNLKKTPKMYDLLTKDKNSIWMYIRNMLDPRLGATHPELLSNLIDNEFAFIPLITNNVTGVSGWPSPTLPTKETTPGLRKEQMIFPDGDRSINNLFDLDLTVKNIAGSPIEKILTVWQDWMCYNAEGIYMPTPDWLAGNESTYDTRVYRLVLDSTYTFVRKIACTGSSVLLNTEEGKHFDFSNENHRVNNKDVTARLSSSGARYNEARIMLWFNQTVATFNPAMWDVEGKTDTRDMLKVPSSYAKLVNYRCYPWINLKTYELEWWVKRDQIKVLEKES